ncbi:MAG TPA: competence protein ComK [Ureibacillus sp.]|nr:competence protein ComK [Ureibacillus sp.]
MSKNASIIDFYRISLNTYIIIPIQNGKKTYAHIYDKNGEYIVELKPLYIVRKSCNGIGYNYNIAKKFSKSFFGKEKHKLPLLISYNESPNIFFPLFSPSSPNNIWIGLDAIINIKRLKDSTEITLRDGKEIVLPINYASFCSLYVSATMLRKHAANQKKMIENELNQPLEIAETKESIDHSFDQD